MKKFLFTLLFIFTIIPNVFGSSTPEARVGNNYYDNLADAIANATSTDTIQLLSDANLDESLMINKTININLNGHNITAPSAVFVVQGGTLNISGKGTIKETQPNYGAIKVIGSNEYISYDYSTVNVGEDVTLEGWSGIFITHDNKKSYGIRVDFDGKINAVSDVSGGEGIGIYVNGIIQDEANSPIINIGNNAEIYSNGSGLYIAGYATFNIKDAYIEGTQSGIAIKSGVLNIDGATVVCNGEDTTPTEGYTNGVNSSGTTIQIESNSGYVGNMVLNISNGKFSSKNSNVIYEYIGKGNASLVKEISLSGGSFVSGSNKDVFNLSSKFKELHPSFISGGEYTSNPSPYLKSGYTATLEDKFYIVSRSSAKTVFFEGGNNIGSMIGKILITIVVIAAIVIGYLKRSKLIQILSDFIARFKK